MLRICILHCNVAVSGFTVITHHTNFCVKFQITISHTNSPAYSRRKKESFVISNFGKKLFVVDPLTLYINQRKRFHYPNFGIYTYVCFSNFSTLFNKQMMFCLHNISILCTLRCETLECIILDSNFVEN